MLSKVLRGIAVADAIGNPLEFYSIVTREDVTESSKKKVLRVSDDTQMTLFCAEALISAGDDISLAEPNLRAAYLRWFSTQHRKPQQVESPHGLTQFESLYSVEAPGRTCMASCRSLTIGQAVVNDSKGNGTVMRCAPIALWAHKHQISRPESYIIAARDACITHKHPYAAQSSVLLVAIYHNLFEGMDFPEAVTSAVAYLQGAGYLSLSVANLCLDALDPVLFDHIKLTRGGWVAEEALAIAIGAVARSNTYFEAIQEAIAIAGDSDTTGGIAGGLASAAGMPPPESLTAKLNVLDAITYVENNFK